MKGIRVAVLVLTWTLWSVHELSAQPEPFYKGKTIRVVVGFTPGGLYDLWGRLLARHLPKHIPGGPKIIIQNMPGAGSLVAANFLYNVARPDGLNLGMFAYNLYLQQLLGGKEVQLDVRRFEWIGSQEKDQVVLYIRADSPFRSVEDIIKAKEPPTCGATAISDTTALAVKMLEETAGAKFNLVFGYPGGAQIDLAMERGEVICRATRVSVHVGREPFLTWHKGGFIRRLVQFGRKRDPRIAEVPTLYELMDKHSTPEMNRRVAEVIMAGDELGRPMVAPPGTPLARVRILRDAYNKAMNDPSLVDEVRRAGWEMDPSTGEELQQLINKVLDQRGEVMQRLKALLR